MAQSWAGRDAAGSGPGNRQELHHEQRVDAAWCGIAQGTQVLTLEGALPVEYLTPGDRIVTRMGARRLEAIELGRAEDRVIRVAPGVLGHDRPERALLLGPGARVLLRDWRARAIFGAAQALVPVSRLVDGQFVTVQTRPGLRLFSLRLADYAVIYADGVELGMAAAVTA